MSVRICIADDEDASRCLLHYNLNRASEVANVSLEVEVIESPSEALLALSQDHFDAIICDGTGWSEVINVAKDKTRLIVYTGDESLVYFWREQGVPCFLKCSYSSIGLGYKGVTEELLKLAML